MAKYSRQKPPSQGAITAEVRSLNHEGRGVTQIDGKTTFLFGALPAETVQFQYTHCHRQFDEGVVTTVLKGATTRVSPQCVHFGVCGGCSLQHLSDDGQMAHKQAVLLEHFLHQANTQPNTLLPPIQSPSWGYRRKARLSVRHVTKKNKVLVGFRERNGRFVADIQRCEILDVRIGPHINALSDLLMQLDGKNDIPQIEVAAGDRAMALIFRHLAPLSETDLSKLIAFAVQYQFQLYLQPHGPESVYCIYPDETSKLSYTLENLTLDFHPTQFIQINQHVNERMLQQAIDLLALTPTDRVLDLFCGMGNFSLPIATRCQHVIGVEGSREVITQAQKNAVKNRISNIDFHVFDLTQSLTHVTWANQHFDKLLLDPPRAGAKELLPFIATWQPDRIVYVSCNPITLARDAEILLKLGYSLEKAGVMNMFPHTQHIEAMALFSRHSHEKRRATKGSSS